MSAIVGEIEKIVPMATRTITFAENAIAMPSTLDDSAIQAALGGIPRTSMETGMAETIGRFRELQEEGRLDLSDLDQ